MPVEYFHLNPFPAVDKYICFPEFVFGARLFYCIVVYCSCPAGTPPTFDHSACAPAKYFKNIHVPVHVHDKFIYAFSVLCTVLYIYLFLRWLHFITIWINLYVILTVHIGFLHFSLLFIIIRYILLIWILWIFFNSGFTWIFTWNISFHMKYFIINYSHWIWSRYIGTYTSTTEIDFCVIR